MPSNTLLQALTLGKPTQYPHHYDATLLQSIPRSLKRDELQITQQQPFNFGVDVWTFYELSWLNPNGIPQVAIADIFVDAQSLNIMESKSVKLYLNSFNQTHFTNIEQVEQTLVQDLSHCVVGHVKVHLHPLSYYNNMPVDVLMGECIDEQDITISTYQYTPELLENATGKHRVEETLVSHVLKSNCLITHQPDWASLQIHYIGSQINQQALLRYIVSFREHQEFHEQCIERIFCDIMHYIKPEKLSVYARYTRRGGLDINPYRSNFEPLYENHPLARQ